MDLKALKRENDSLQTEIASIERQLSSLEGKIEDKLERLETEFGVDNEVDAHTLLGKLEKEHEQLTKKQEKLLEEVEKIIGENSE